MLLNDTAKAPIARLRPGVVARLSPGGEIGALTGKWRALWLDRAAWINDLVLVRGDTVKPLLMPPHDDGASAADMIAPHKQIVSEIYP
jgi:hypothetical protein